MLVLVEECALGGCLALEMLPSSVRMAYESWRLTCMGPEGGSNGGRWGLHLQVTTSRADQADLPVSPFIGPKQGFWYNVLHFSATVSSQT